MPAIQRNIVIIRWRIDYDANEPLRAMGITSQRCPINVHQKWVGPCSLKNVSRQRHATTLLQSKGLEKHSGQMSSVCKEINLVGLAPISRANGGCGCSGNGCLPHAHFSRFYQPRAWAQVTKSANFTFGTAWMSRNNVISLERLSPRASRSARCTVCSPIGSCWENRSKQHNVIFKLWAWSFSNVTRNSNVSLRKSRLLSLLTALVWNERWFSGKIFSVT